VMPSRGAFYGVVALMVALLIFSSTLAAVYYGRSQQEESQSQQDVSELNAALARYNALAGSYNKSLADYYATLSLLSGAVANLNTSTPAYRNASVALASLWDSYQKLDAANGGRALAYVVDVLIDYGNGTSRWLNGSTAQPGWNAFVLTLVLTDGMMQAVWYPQFGEHFVTGIYGALGTSSESWFVWEFGKGGWALAPMGADAIAVQNGTALAWTLCGYDANFNPDCTP
jgi:hypothetical protein